VKADDEQEAVVFFEGIHSNVILLDLLKPGMETYNDVLRGTCTSNIVHQKYRGSPSQGGPLAILDLAFTLTTGPSISAML
jgi:hypothetical protein